jgi:hypothetical protein
MLSTIPANHQPQRRRFKSFSEKQSVLKNPQSDLRKGERGAKISGPASILIDSKNTTEKRQITERIALLVQVYAQDLFVFGD